MAPSKVSDLNSLYNSLYQGAYYVMRENGLMPPLVTRLSADTYAPRIFSTTTQVTATALTEGSAASESTLATTAIGTATPITVQATFILTEQMMMTDPDDAARRGATEAGLALANKIDSDLVSQFADFTASAGTAGSSLTLANIATAMARLAYQTAAMGEVYAVVGNGTWNDLYTQLTNVSTNPVAASGVELVNTALRQYHLPSVGPMIGATWFATPVIGTTGTAGTATCGLFKRDALVLDVRRDYRLDRWQIEKSLNMAYMWTIMYAAECARTDYGVKLSTRNYIA